MKNILPPLAALALCACATTPAPAPREPAPIPNVPEFSATIMKNMVRELSSDAYEGRAPGTPGDAKSIAYIERQFAAADLQPGNAGKWTQDVPLVEITAKDISPLTVKGKGAKLSFAYGPEFMGGTYRVTPRVDIKDSELVFVGYGVVAPEKDWNDYAGVDMRGKTAVILVNDPDHEMEGQEGPFNGRAMTYYGRWTYKYEEAARQGVAAALIVHDTFPAAYGWNVVESSGKGPQAFARSKDGGAAETLFNGWIQKEVAARMLAASGQDLAALSAAAKMQGFRPVPLGISASLSFANDIRQTTTSNVIGLLPGKTRPDEYVLYTAHYDHLGVCAPSEADPICNGAVDNATGTAALVALADAFRRAGTPERSVLFIALGAEESGLLGSKYYAENPVYPLSRTVGGVNMDALYPHAPARDVKVIGGGKSELDAVLQDAVAAEGRYMTPDPTPEKGFYYRSDHFSFAKLGVPMFYVEAGEDLEPGGTAAGKAIAEDYIANRYHAPGDEYSEDWDWSGLLRELRMFYRLGRKLADSDAWPNWYQGDEFRAARNASCAGDGGC
ncbi:MAG: M28 family peptidase [Alphaproteobacteria bacterium]|nr:M28 family peptidase [Alphaproteobacteria bacterium]